MIVAASDGNELHAAELLAAVGLRVRGFLGGGMSAWRAEERPVERIEAIGPEELAARLDGDEGRGEGARGDSGAPVVLDVRREAEFAEAHIPGSFHIPFGDLPERLGELPRDRPIATICKGGKRSGLAASILQREGFEGVVHVARGGVGTWAREGRPMEAVPAGDSA